MKPNPMNIDTTQTFVVTIGSPDRNERHLKRERKFAVSIPAEALNNWRAEGAQKLSDEQVLGLVLAEATDAAAEYVRLYDTTEEPRELDIVPCDRTPPDVLESQPAFSHGRASLWLLR
jgi:hypothetical protein